MNWLFVTSRFPWPLTHGSWLRVYHLARHLVRLGEVVGVLSHPAPPEAADAYAAAGVRSLPGPTGPLPDRGRGRCLLAQHVFDPELARSVARCAPGQDALVLVREKTLQYAPEARPAGVVVCDMIDDPVLKQARDLPARGAACPRLRGRWFAFRERRYEDRFAAGVDGFVFVTPEDGQHFAARHRGVQVACVSNGVDAEHFRPPARAPAPDRPTVLFIGNLASPINQEAVLFLLGRVAPRVWASRPEARFVIVGPAPSERVRALASERVTVAGYVQDVREPLGSATVVSIPMRSGTGIKNKLLEAWAMRRAVVATALACQGLPARDGENLLVGDSPQQHAAAIVRLIGDAALREALASAGRAAVEQGLSWRHAAERLRTLCQGFARARRGPPTQ